MNIFVQKCKTSSSCHRVYLQSNCIWSTMQVHHGAVSSTDIFFSIEILLILPSTYWSTTHIHKLTKHISNTYFSSLTYIWKHSGSVGLIGGIHLLMTPIAPLIAASIKSHVTL